jgi:hypothetical protein
MKYQPASLETATYETALECWEEIGRCMQNLRGKTVFIRSPPEVHVRKDFISGKMLYRGTMRMAIPEKQP